MAWKQRVLWTLVSMIAGFLAASLATRRFHAEIADIRSELLKQTALINTMVDGVQARLNTHG